MYVASYTYTPHKWAQTMKNRRQHTEIHPPLPKSPAPNFTVHTLGQYQEFLSDCRTYVQVLWSRLSSGCVAVKWCTCYFVTVALKSYTLASSTTMFITAYVWIYIYSYYIYIMYIYIMSWAWSSHCPQGPTNRMPSKCKWFQSYISGWSQYVTYNGVKSPTKQIKCVFPQGSIFGRLLFLAYTWCAKCV